MLTVSWSESQIEEYIIIKIILKEDRSTDGCNFVKILVGISEGKTGL
jgi:hypothetical protein